MILDGLDEALEEANRTPCQDTPRRRRTRMGWRQIAAQICYVLAVTAFVVLLLCCGGDR
ncbi:hypothetical protein [Streptomyces sp. NPDC054940]